MILINEDRTISINGSAFPRSGWAFIILGGPGSGKNYILNNQLPIDGKVFDIDKVVEQCVNAYIKNEYENDTMPTKAKLNNVVKTCRSEIAPQIINSMRRLFFNKQNRTTLDNVIFLNCGNKKNNDLVGDIISQVKEFGYKVCIIFVAANRSVALNRNLQRGRTVDDKGFHSRSTRANNFINDFLTKNSYPEVDIAYLILSSGPNLNVSNDDNNVIKLEKTGNGFRLPNNNEMKPNNQFVQTVGDLNKFLGRKETFRDSEGKQRRDPQVYLNAREIRKNNMEPNKDGTYLREMALRRKIKSMVIETLKKLK